MGFIAHNIVPEDFKNLNYVTEEFNDPVTQANWESIGHKPPYTGAMCDMRQKQPSWNSKVIDFFRTHNHWLNIGTSYYRMDPGTVLPNHADTYNRYVELFKLKGREDKIFRAVIFLEDWQPGHYAEYDGRPFVNWSKGDFVVWQNDLPHMAANIGSTPRYTLQVTGHVA